MNNILLDLIDDTRCNEDKSIRNQQEISFIDE